MPKTAKQKVDSVIIGRISGRYARALRMRQDNVGESTMKATVHGLIRDTKEYKELEKIETR